jgi:2,3-bisphosphoglycerate-dependent phosphoglycerate mutase
MTRLILVRHSLPAIDPAIPAPDWRLSDEGRRRAELLAQRLTGHGPGRTVSSPEPKALETARIIHAQQADPVTIVPDLREQERRRGPHLTPQAFQEAVIASLRHPDEVRFGEESAGAARQRFTAAIADQLAATPPEQTLTVVTHGTVLALYVAAVTGVDAVDLWRRLGLPSYVTLTRPDLTLVDVIETIAAE